MPVTEYAALLNGAGNISKSALINATEQRGIYVIEDGETPSDLTPGFATHLAYRGIVFWYDSTDSLTPHDGVACIVTADGKRFKSDGFDGAQTRHWVIQDKDLTAPPGIPVIGASYIVAVGGSGAWATHDKKVATWTSRGWAFNVAAAFDLASVVDEVMTYHFSAGGTWTSGFPFLTMGADTILPSALRYGRFGLSVVNQTTDTPPPTPTDGDAYIIGPTPTGVWTGHTRKIAIYQTSAWVIYTPYEGAQVYDASTNTQVRYDGIAWGPLTSGYAAVVFGVPIVADVTITGTYAYSATAPTTANMTLVASLNIQAKKAGSVFEVQAVFPNLTNTGSSNITNTLQEHRMNFGLFVDAIASAVDWVRGPNNRHYANAASEQSGYETSDVASFLWTAPDTLAHTLKIYASKNNTGSFTGPGSTPTVVGARAYMIARETA